MGAEDFHFLQERPGCYVWLGSGQGPDSPGHHPRFDFNDDVLVTGASYWVRPLKNAPAARSQPKSKLAQFLAE